MPMQAYIKRISVYRIAGKIGGTKFWRMSKKDCFGKYNFGVSALAARSVFILVRQNLANNRPFAKFANFTPSNIFRYIYGSQSGIPVTQNLLRGRMYVRHVAREKWLR